MKTNKDIAVYVLESLKKAGADHAQCIVSTGRVDELNVDGGKFSLLRTLFNSSISLKALKGGRKGTITANRLDKESIDKAVEDCIISADSSVPDEAESISERINNGNFKTGVLSPNRDRLFDRLREFLDDVKKSYPKIIIEQLISYYQNTECLFMNTNGVEFTDISGKYNLSSMFSAHENENSSSFMGYDFDFSDLDRKLINFGMQNELFAEFEKQIYTKPYNGKFVGSLLISPVCFIYIISISISNFMSDATIIDGTSPWKAILGKQVTSDKLTLS